MKFIKGQTPWNKGLKGYQAGEQHYNFGHTWSDEIKAKMSRNRKGLTAGENHPAWKGDAVGYRSIHDWVTFRRGKAKSCTFDSEHQATRYHWANISKSYLRDLDDWTSLCPKCHKQYDLITKGRVYLRA